MVVQMLADPFHVAHHRDAELLQQFARAEPRQLQQLRRAVDAAGDDDLAPGKGGLAALRRMVFDADRAAALEQDAGRMRLGRDGQVRRGRLAAPR